MRILLIHGMGQGGKNPEQLKKTWIETLEKGFKSAGLNFPNDVELDFPFYGDKLEQFKAAANLPTSEDIGAKGAGENKEFEQFKQSALSEMKTRSAISDEEVMAEMAGGSVEEKGMRNWRWVQAIARVIDHHLTDVSDFTIENWLKEVFLYVNKPAVMAEINKIIEEKLTDEPTIVIGHSLGSVVGYKVLTKNSAKMKLVKYITVGCPLGLTAISSKFGVLQNPGGEDGWYNAYDERDIVALNPLDDHYFPTDPAITNYNGVDNFTNNRHGIIGYLNDPKLAQQIAKALA